MTIELPNELKTLIYLKCNRETRINLNKTFRWSYTEMNPYKDYNMIKRNLLQTYMVGKWMECGFFKYIPKI